MVLDSYLTRSVGDRQFQLGQDLPQTPLHGKKREKSWEKGGRREERRERREWSPGEGGKRNKRSNEGKQRKVEEKKKTLIVPHSIILSGSPPVSYSKPSLEGWGEAVRKLGHSGLSPPLPSPSSALKAAQVRLGTQGVILTHLD